MSLPAPHLDDRKFQDIVDDVKRQIGLRCPEWTDHNVSDPGVTLIELFAGMMEMAMYRMNQVPERNYIRFLELLGIQLQMAAPARTDLHFMLTRPIPDAPNAENDEVLLPARRTAAATYRTETEEAVEFSTELDLRMVRPRLVEVVAVPALDNGDPALEAGPLARRFGGVNKELDANEAFEVFSSAPRQGDCVYFGFGSEVSGNIVRLVARCQTAAAKGLREAYPSQVFEALNVASGSWERVEVKEDTTFGFNRDGGVTLVLPRGLQPTTLGNTSAIWIRARYTLSPLDLPPRPPEGLTPANYEASPEVTYLQAETLGGWAPAANCQTVFGELLGYSDATPGQEFTTLRSPVLDFGPEETVLVGPLGEQTDDFSQLIPWTRVADFSQSGPNDRHFTLDCRTGRVTFGPNLVEPDGGARQYGAVPEKGMAVVVSRYRVGGGTRGNVREHRIRVLRSNYPYIQEVTNPRTAAGGTDIESLEHAKMRAMEILKVRNRAVTAEDFEFLAKKATTEVGRARCIQPTQYPQRASETVQPGAVRVLLIPNLGTNVLTPSGQDLRMRDRAVNEVREYLDERRLLTTVLEIGEPDYVFISTDIKLVADPQADPELVAQRVRDALCRFVHPVFGGPNGEGWPWRRALTLADLYGEIGRTRGVAFLLDAKIFTSRMSDPENRVLGSETVASNAEGVRLLESEMFVSREHRIRVVPMSQVGADFGEDEA